MQNTVRWITEQSPFMATRSSTLQREISEIRNQISDKSKVKRAVEESFFILIAKMQLVADVPTWLGQYEKSVAAGEDQAKAVALADQAVLDSQGGGQIKDLAGIQRGGPMRKLWTNFYSYFSTTYNLMAESVGETRLVGPSRLPLLAADFLLLATLPASLGYILRTVLRGDDEEPEDFAKNLGKENLFFMTSMMVGVRDIAAATSGDTRAAAPAGIMLNRFVKFGQQAQQGEVDEAFFKAANQLGGVLFHYPAAQVQRTASGVQALANGDTSNPAAALLGPPMDKSAKN
jgi:hypothetical protein